LNENALHAPELLPKMLARIARFNRAVQMSRETNLTWTEIAHETRYHDHMHMVRDFRSLAGEAPSHISRQIAPHHIVNFCKAGHADKPQQSAGPSR
jgi:AraC-like DNA-binding protein